MTLTAEELRKFFATLTEPLDILEWLQSRFIVAVRTVFNSDDVRRRLGLYAGDRIPDNERNLTDVRNRVSLIVEYELARISTRLLEEAKVKEIFWSYVVANRFPDLEVRDSEGKRHLRIEVKNLQSVAEEKSANFDTLRKDVHPQTDFLVVFLWEWKADDGKPWDRAPFIHNVFVFHASSLALLRDCYWLNSPPTTLGDGLQGFDLRYGINCRNGKYNEEEGNYGKLLRLWQKDFGHAPPMTPILERTAKDYHSFQEEVIVRGFETIAAIHLPKLSGDAPMKEVLFSGKRVGFNAGNYVFLLDYLIQDEEEAKEYVAAAVASRVVRFTSQYAWKEVSAAKTEAGRKTKKVRIKLTKVREGRKPKHLQKEFMGVPPVAADGVVPPVVAPGQAGS
jgi:hypothetical protein